MTKSELINRLAERYSQLVAKDAEFAVMTILDAMTGALASGQRIEIRGFGSFALNSRPPRIGRNPKSGDKVEALVINIDRKARSIQLSIKAKDNADTQEAMQKLASDNSAATGTTSLGALLKAKFDNKG